MRKISKNGAIGIGIILLLLISGYPAILAEVQVDSERLSDDVLYSRYMAFHQRKEIAIISMDAIIDLYKENGINTSELINLKVRLIDLDIEAKKAAETMNRDEFYNTMEESRELITSLRKLVKEKSVEGQNEAVRNALIENKDYILGLRTEISKFKREIYLKIIDNRIEKLGRISNRLEGKGADVTEINKKIDALSDSRSSISKESSWAQLNRFHQDAKQTYQELRVLIREEIKELKK